MTTPLQPDEQEVVRGPSIWTLALLLLVLIQCGVMFWVVLYMDDNPAPNAVLPPALVDQREALNPDGSQLKFSFFVFEINGEEWVAFSTEENGEAKVRIAKVKPDADSP